MMLSHHAGDGGKKARLTREITKETVKTIAQGMPDRSGGPVVTNSCAFYLLHARLRVRRRTGIPCALFFGRKSHASPGRISRRGNTD
jgi:hypothetical protein